VNKLLHLQGPKTVPTVAIFASMFTAYKFIHVCLHAIHVYKIEGQDKMRIVQHRCTINLKFIALSRIHRSACFGHCCAHHQEPTPTTFAATGYRMIAGLDVLQAVVSLLVRLQCVLAELQFVTRSQTKPYMHINTSYYLSSKSLIRFPIR
jgi:hypothetical protein